MSSSNPIQLNYLVFDDENDEKNQNSINVKIPGYSFNVIFLNPNDYYDVEKHIFDIDAFKNKIIEETKGNQISLVATDWNMLDATNNYEEINGLTIVNILIDINEKYKKCPFLIYSGKPSDASKVLISKIKDEVNSQVESISSLQLLSLLLELRIKFCPRNTRFGEIQAVLKDNKNVSSILMNALANFEDSVVIKTGNEYYDGRKLGDLKALIEQDSDLGLKFVRDFIEISIANYTELNAE